MLVTVLFGAPVALAAPLAEPDWPAVPVAAVDCPLAPVAPEAMLAPVLLVPLALPAVADAGSVLAVAVPPAVPAVEAVPEVPLPEVSVLAVPPVPAPLPIDEASLEVTPDSVPPPFMPVELHAASIIASKPAKSTLCSLRFMINSFGWVFFVCVRDNAACHWGKRPDLEQRSMQPIAGVTQVKYEDFLLDGAAFDLTQTALQCSEE